MKKKRLHIHPLAEGISIFAISLITMSVCIYFIYARSLNALQEEIKEGLVRTVSSAATTINGDLHKKFRSMAQKHDPEYVEFLKKLEAIRVASKHVRYLYTNIMVNGKIYFIANPSPQNDNDGDGKPDEAPQLMDPYPDAGEALKKALTNKTTEVDMQPYTDIWGTFYSAYAPFYTRNGDFVGTMGMDLELKGFNERLEPVKISTKRAYIAAIVLAILSGTAVWIFRSITLKLFISKDKTSIKLKNIQEALDSKESVFFHKLSTLTAIIRDNIKQKDLNTASGTQKNADAVGINIFLEKVLNYANNKINNPDKINNANLSVKELLRDVLLSPDLVPQKVNITYSIDDKLPLIISGDEKWLKKILLLFLTSRTILNRESKITIEIKLRDEALQTLKMDIDFSFDSINIDQTEFEQMFDSFSIKDTYVRKQIEYLDFTVLYDEIINAGGSVMIIPRKTESDDNRILLIIGLSCSKSIET